MHTVPTIESIDADLIALTDGCQYAKMDEFTQKRIDVLLTRRSTLMGVTHDGSLHCEGRNSQGDGR